MMQPTCEKWMKRHDGTPARAWVVCDHALAGAEILPPKPPHGKPWVGSVVCVNKRADRHAE